MYVECSSTCTIWRESPKKKKNKEKNTGNYKLDQSCAVYDFFGPCLFLFVSYYCQRWTVIFHTDKQVYCYSLHSCWQKCQQMLDELSTQVCVMWTKTNKPHQKVIQNIYVQVFSLNCSLYKVVLYLCFSGGWRSITCVCDLQTMMTNVFAC